jgi:diguanylate cyclase (GGDEF)-like protein
MRQKNPFHLLQGAYRVVLVAFLAMVILLSVIQKNVVYNPWKDEKPKITEITDYEVREVKDADAPAGFYRDYIIQLKKGSIVNEAWLYVFLSHCYVKIFFEEAPDEPIYTLSSKDNHKNLGKSPGNRWVDIPMYEDDWNHKLIIRTYPVYKGYLMTPVLYLGTQRDVTSYLTNQGMLPLILSLALLFLGMSAFFLFSFRKKKHQSNEGMDQLGLLCMLAGLWRITDIRMAPLIFKDMTSVLSYFSLSMLYLLLVPVTRYVYTRVRLSRKWPLYLTMGVYVLFDFIAFLLQILGVRDLRQDLPYFQVLAVGGGLLMLVMVLVDLRIKRVQNQKLKRGRPQVRLLFVFSVALIAGIAVDLGLFYMGNSNMSFSTLVFLFYVLTTLFYYYRQLSQSANFDVATGLANKNSCIRVLADIRSGSNQVQAGEKEENIALVMLDLNYLKRTNDRHGHEAGDQVLSAFSELIRTSFEKEDFIGRYGGDEFLVIVRGKNADRVRDNLKTLDNMARQISVVLSSRQTLTISFSAGVSYSREDPDADGWALLKKADARMYEDKMRKHAQRKDS